MRLLAGALLLVLILPAAADYKIVTRTSRSNGKKQDAYISVRLVRGARQWSQVANGQVAIAQCDRRQLVWLNPDAKLYRIIKLADDGYPLGIPGFGRRPPSATKVVTVELPDRATIFGHPAWHVQDVIEDGRTKVDSWYIDLPIADGCVSAAQPPWYARDGGGARRGFPVLTRYAYSTKAAASELVVQVTEFQETALDPALFEIPPDYREALDAAMTIPPTPANRAKQAWKDMWTALAKFIYE